jgi:RimJ/RimL family protein N-acetyltransferase
MLAPFALEGRHARLEPLAERHVEGLAAAAAEDRSSYGFTRVPDGIAGTQEYVRQALAEQATGHTLPFAVRRLSDDRLVGSTRYLDLEAFGTPDGVPADDRPPTVLEIGATWYAASAQRTAVNTDVKLALLTQAFEGWGVLRVTLKTDARNQRSRAGIARLGAQFEGVRRAHMLAPDGTVRDTAYYSILRAEWPEIRDFLERRLTSGAA